MQLSRTSLLLLFLGAREVVHTEWTALSLLPVASLLTSDVPKQVPRPLRAEASNAARDKKAGGAAAANEGILVWVGGGLVPRDMAKVGGSRVECLPASRHYNRRKRFQDEEAAIAASLVGGAWGALTKSILFIKPLLCTIYTNIIKEVQTRSFGRRRPPWAQVSVFDSSVQGGDAVWEGIRVYKGKVFCLDRCVLWLYALSSFAAQNMPCAGGRKTSKTRTFWDSAIAIF